MHRLISFYNKNRKMIFIVIFVIIVIFALLRTLNNFYLKQNKTLKQADISSNISNVTSGVRNQDFDLSGTKKDKDAIELDQKVLEEFIKNCNEKNITQAYGMLTDECKENLFKTEEIFINNYYKNVFNNSKKNYTIENWNGKTYKIKFSEDILSSGNIDKNSSVIDYITVKKVDGESKLNINNFIKRVKFKKQIKQNGITMQINYKDVYMDYEIYNFTFENDTNVTVLLDSLDKTDSVYIEDKNGAKYNFNNYEITKDSLLLQKKSSNTINIKFNNPYRTDKEIQKIVFSNIIINYSSQSNQTMKLELKMK